MHPGGAPPEKPVTPVKGMPGRARCGTLAADQPPRATKAPSSGVIVMDVPAAHGFPARRQALCLKACACRCGTGFRGDPWRRLTQRPFHQRAQVIEGVEPVALAGPVAARPDDDLPARVPARAGQGEEAVLHVPPERRRACDIEPEHGRARGLVHVLSPRPRGTHVIPRELRGVHVYVASEVNHPLMQGHEPPPRLPPRDETAGSRAGPPASRGAGAPTSWPARTRGRRGRPS